MCALSADLIFEGLEEEGSLVLRHTTPAPSSLVDAASGGSLLRASMSSQMKGTNGFTRDLSISHKAFQTRSETNNRRKESG